MEGTPEPLDARELALATDGRNLASSDAPTTRRGYDVDLHVTERHPPLDRSGMGFGGPSAGRELDATVHSQLTPPMAAMGVAPAPLTVAPTASAPAGTAPSARQRQRSSVPLPRLRDAIRSAADVERARDQEHPSRPWLVPVGIAAATVLVVLVAAPLVVGIAVHKHRNNVQAAEVAEPPPPAEHMGIPVRQDLLAPAE